MQNHLNVLLVLAFCLLLAVVLPCSSDPLPREQSNLSRPERPNVFRSPEELRKYLDSLSEFYAYAGRPRFGKRLAAPVGFRPSSSYNSVANEAINSGRYQPSGNTNDLYEMLFQYDE